jgi:hypothetical protein
MTEKFYEAGNFRICRLRKILRRISTFKGIEAMAEKMTEGERASLRAELEHLRQEHRDLDSAIEALLHLGAGDQLQIQRLKKRKLILRDRLCFIEDKLTPDIIA